MVRARIWGPLSDIAKGSAPWGPAAGGTVAVVGLDGGPQPFGVEGVAEHDLDLGGGLLCGEVGGEPFAGDDVEDCVGDPVRPREMGVGVGPQRLAVFRSAGFCGPPSEPDVRLSPHPALRAVMPLVRVTIGAASTASRVPATRPPRGQATKRRYSPADSPFRIEAATTLGPFAMCTAFPCSDYYEPSAPSRRHQPATGLPARRPGREAGRDQRDGSHVHS